MDAVMQALADPSRRTMLEILRDHEATAGELAGALPIARPGVSRHLRVLRECGLVDVRQEAQRRIYRLCPEALIEVDEWLGAYRGLWQHRLDALHTEIRRGRKVTELGAAYEDAFVEWEEGGDAGDWDVTVPDGMPHDAAG